MRIQKMHPMPANLKRSKVEALGLVPGLQNVKKFETLQVWVPLGLVTLVGAVGRQRPDPSIKP